MVVIILFKSLRILMNKPGPKACSQETRQPSLLFTQEVNLHSMSVLFPPFACGLLGSQRLGVISMTTWFMIKKGQRFPAQLM